MRPVVGGVGHEMRAQEESIRIDAGLLVRLWRCGKTGEPFEGSLEPVPHHRNAPWSWRRTSRRDAPGREGWTQSRAKPGVHRVTTDHRTGHPFDTVCPVPSFLSFRASQGANPLNLGARG